jgi:hypothetical protein
LDAPAFRDRLGELTGNELKLWMYLWLRTSGELTSFPSNETMAQDLDISIDTVKAAKRGLRDKGWTSKESQRTQANGIFSTVVEKIHLPWGEKPTAVTVATVVEKTDDGKTHQEVVFKDLEVPPSPAASEDSEIQKNEGNNNNRVVVVVPQLVAGYAREAVAEHVAKFPEGSWVWQNATRDALERPGFVEHVMGLDPPRKPRAGHAAANPELHTGLDAQGKSWVADKTNI